MTTVRPKRNGGARAGSVATPAAQSRTGLGPPAAQAPTRLRADGDLGRRLGDRLARLVALGEGATLASATVASPAVDPIAVFAAAAEAGLEAALWLRPSEGVSFAGIGRTWVVEAEGRGRFLEAEAAFQALLAGARLDVAGGIEVADGLDVADGSGVAHRADILHPSDGSAGAHRTAGTDVAPRTPAGGPVLLGGLGFSGRRPDPEGAWSAFGASSMVLPALLVRSGPDGATITASLVPGRDPAGPQRLDDVAERLLARARDLTPGPGGIVARPVFAPLHTTAEQPSRPAWNRIVGMYAGAVGRGRMDKVVLARRVDLRAPVELDVPNALRRLAASAPESTIFAFRREGRTFLGATPERLVRTTGRRFLTAAIAGTTGRGADAAEDERLATQLLSSEKDREEQRIVVAAIRNLLTPVAETLEVEPRPSVMRLRYAQHLATSISGTLPERHGLLSVAGLLHPTPAVGGEPLEAALTLIDEHEGFDRGWYSGPVGWLGADGDGELCVALRCGIVERTRAVLFAGCGIVADSNADAEWEESRIKLRAVVASLGIPAEEPG